MKLYFSEKSETLQSIRPVFGSGAFVRFRFKSPLLLKKITFRSAHLFLV